MKISDIRNLLDPEVPVTIRYYGAAPADKPIYSDKPGNLFQNWKKGIAEINKMEIVTVCDGASSDTSKRRFTVIRAA